jgi:hypothetical protein
VVVSNGKTLLVCGVNGSAVLIGIMWHSPLENPGQA